MLKILQIGDLHLDAILDYLDGEKREARSKQLENTLIRIIDLALEEKVKILLVLGDLFENNRPGKNLINLVNEQFQRLLEAEVKIIILPGSHDYWGENSVYRKIKQEKGIYFFTQPTWEHLLIPELALSFYGCASVEGQDFSQRMLPKLKKAQESGLHIGLFHGSLENLAGRISDYYPFSLEELEESKLDYWALGHYHCCWIKEKGVKAGYGGSPESLCFQEKGSGYVLFLHIENNRLTAIEPKKVSSQQLRQLVILCDPYTSLEEIVSRIKELRQPNLLLRVVLTGVIAGQLDLDQLRESLAEEFFYLYIEDRTSKFYDCLENNDCLTVKSCFIEMLTKRITSTQAEKEKRKLELALSLGLEALSGGEKGC